MLISEQSFPHLQAAHDARLEQELERQRVAAERLEELGGPRPRHRAWWQRWSERMPRARVAAPGTSGGPGAPHPA